jgi:hypothetical protein
MSAKYLKLYKILTEAYLQTEIKLNIECDDCVAYRMSQKNIYYRLYRLKTIIEKVEYRLLNGFVKGVTYEN